MDRSVFQGIYSQQKASFNRQMTKSYEQRVEVLKNLRAQILKYESRIIQTMQADMAKPETEANRPRDLVRPGGDWIYLTTIEKLDEAPKKANTTFAFQGVQCNLPRTV